MSGIRLDRSARLAGSAVLVLLVVLAAGCTTTDEATDFTLTDIEWQWVSVGQQAGDPIVVPNPEDYTITFRTDGTFSGKADCNQIGGTYTQDGGAFAIELGRSTRAFCGEESMDQQYLTLLGNVAAGGPTGDGDLALESAGGADRMEFQNGGPAPASIQ